jgi:type IV pilus assembly protein PilC
MPLYLYKAINQEGKRCSGSYFSTSKKTLYQELQKDGLRMISSKQSLSRFPSFRKTIPLEDLLDFCVHMEQLDRSGLPIIDAILSLSESMENARLKSVLFSISHDLHQGLLLSQSMAHHPQIFNSLFVHLIEVSEKTGEFSSAFSRIQDYLRWQRDFQTQLSKATRYPAILLGTIFMMLGLLANFIMPDLERYLVSIGNSQQLPLATRALLSAIHLSSYFLQMSLFILSSYGCFIFIARTNTKANLFKSYLSLKVPWIGRLRQQLMTSEFLYCFALMSSSGIDLISSLSKSTESVPNMWLKFELSKLTKRISSGHKISEAFSSLNQFSPFIIRLISLGEETGTLPQLLLQTADFQLKNNIRKLQSVLTWIEPTLILVIGAIIIWIVTAVMVPLYDNLAVYDL